MKRKEFLRKTLSILSVVTVAPFLWQCMKKSKEKIAISMDKLTNLRKIGGWQVKKIKENMVFLYRKSKTEVVALDAVCTHQGCIIGFNGDKTRIICPCHKSNYSLEGKVLDGPAPRPLEKFNAKVSGDKIIIEI